MIIYEIIGRAPTQTRQYVTTQAIALGLFKGYVTVFKGDLKNRATPKPGFPLPGLSCGVYKVEIRTDIKALEWCQLLTADAPGLLCELTPTDLIVSRVQLAYWNSENTPAKRK